MTEGSEDRTVRIAVHQTIRRLQSAREQAVYQSAEASGVTPDDVGEAIPPASNRADIPCEIALARAEERIRELEVALRCAEIERHALAAKVRAKLLRM